MSQLACRDADVCPNGVPHQSFRVVPEFCRQQRFHGWSNTVDDRTQIPRLVVRRLLKFFQRCPNSSALGMPQNHHQPCAEPLCGELDTANLRGSDDVSGDADDKQIPQALVKDDFCRHPRVGTSENNGEWLLARRQLAAARLIRECVIARSVRHEAAVPFSKSFECFLRGDHQRFGLVRLTPRLSRCRKRERGTSVGCRQSAAGVC